MNELLKRILTAIVFGTLVIGSLLIHPALFALVLIGFIIAGSFEWIRITGYLGHSLKTAFLIIIAVWLFAPVVLIASGLDTMAVPVFLSLLLILPVAAIAEIYRNKPSAVLNLMVLGSGVLYYVVPLAILVMMTQPEFAMFQQDGNILPLFLFIVIWTYDTFAYFIGSLIGRHKLFERLSPKKTWEGMIGGMLITTALMVFVFPLLISLPLGFIFAGTILIIIAATYGDLFESLLKRKAGLKDSGTIFPGHGGVLDRFDSVFFAAPVFLVFCLIYAMLAFN